MTRAAALRFGRFELQPHERRLLVDGQPAAVGSRALDVLIALAERAGALVTKQQLLALVWPDTVVEEGNIQTHISVLRKVLGSDVIATIPGRGYRFALPVRHAGQEASTPAAMTAQPGRQPAPKTNLPAALAPLIGRDNELAQLGALVDRHRLVTVVGAGGMGKTRLARALLHARRDTYPHGVCWVELAQAAHAAALPGAIAAALGVPLGAGDPLAGLIAALAPLDLLLGLDNAETLLTDVAAIAASLHAAAPRLRLLVTCQAPLKVAAEHVYRLGPLAVPRATLPAAQALGYGAVALFVERAQAVDSRYAMADSDAPVVIETCRALDGLPLAIELAAARAPILGTRGLAAALDERLKVLTANPDRAAPARQQTLRAALEWSRALLSDIEGVVFRRLAVFAGSADLDMVQRVVSDNRLDPWAALDALCTLVDRSLVAIIDGDGPLHPRYRLLESPRALALEELQAAGELESLRRRHAQAMAARWDAAWVNRFAGDRVDDWERALDADADNARAAFAWARGNDPALAVPIGTLLLTRHLSDPHSEIARAADALESCLQAQQPTRLRARAWYELSLVWSRVSLRRGLGYAQRAVDLFRVERDRLGLCLSFASVAFIAAASDRALAQAALWDMRALVDPDWPPCLQMLLAMTESHCANQAGEHEDALLHARRTILHQQAAGDSAQVPQLTLVDVELAAGHADVALRDGALLVQRLQGTRHENLLGMARLNLCAAALACGDPVRARQIAMEGLPSAPRFGMQAWWADHLALLAAIEGRVRSAARLAGFADATYLRTQDERQTNEARSVERACDLALTSLGRHEVAQLRAEGAALRDDEFVAVALGSVDR